MTLIISCQTPEKFGDSLAIKRNDFKEMLFFCSDKQVWIKLDEEVTVNLLDKINSARAIEEPKGRANYTISMSLNQGGYLNLLLTGKTFYCDEIDSKVFEIDLDPDYFQQFCKNFNIKKL